MRTGMVIAEDSELMLQNWKLDESGTVLWPIMMPHMLPLAPSTLTTSTSVGCQHTTHMELGLLCKLLFNFQKMVNENIEGCKYLRRND